MTDESAEGPAAAPPVVCITPVSRWNPYQRLLAQALEGLGAEVVLHSRPSLRYALTARPRIDVLHLHWLEMVIGSNSRAARADLFTALSAARLLAVLAVARLRGVRIVWTVHNLVPHESRHPWLDRALGGIVARIAHIVMAHSKHAAEQVAELYGRSEVTVAYHGNYIGHYPAPRRSRSETRAALGVPADAHVLLAFGFVRPYKQLPELIAAFRSVQDPGLRLVVAGKPITAQMEAQVRDAAAGDPRVVLQLRQIADAEVLELHAAADTAVFAYRDVFSSGALMLALSGGLPVVAPANSTADELAAPPVVQPHRPGQVAEAMAGSRDQPAAASQMAKAAAERFPWIAMARVVLGEPR